MKIKRIKMGIHSNKIGYIHDVFVRGDRVYSRIKKAVIITLFSLVIYYIFKFGR